MSVAALPCRDRAAAPTPSGPWLRWFVLANVAGLLAVAIGMRVWHIDNLPGLNGDEAWSGVQAVRLASGHSFALRTPTGNPANPFYLAPLAMLHLWLAPSATAVRLPALVSGLAALGVNFLLCRRAFGARVAWVSTLLEALIPLNIAYCRFGWDTSQTLLATTLVIFLGLDLLPSAGSRRRIWPAIAALAAAVVVHPTNVFSAWFLIVPLGLRYADAIGARVEQVRLATATPRGQVVSVLAGAGLFAVVAWACCCVPLVSAAVARAIDPAQWGLFVRLVVRLFSGSTTCEFIAGPPTGSAELGGPEFIVIALAVAAGIGLKRVLGRPEAQRERALALSALCMAISYFLVAGPAAIAPHVERYGVCLIAPGALLLARGLAWWLEIGAAHARRAAIAMCLLAWISLDLFALRYFALIERTGGESHLAFRTAAVEPKLAAWRFIAHESGAGPIAIAADSWWTHWPLAYYAAGRPDVRFVDEADLVHQAQGQDARAASLQPELHCALWMVEFCESPAAHDIDARLANASLEGRKTVICDYSGRPLLVLVRVTPKSAKIR